MIAALVVAVVLHPRGLLAQDGPDGGAPASDAGSPPPPREDARDPRGPGSAATVRGRNASSIDALGGSVHRVSEEELRALDYTDPDRVMARVPGVYVRSEDGFGLRPNIGMRGANSHRSRRVTLMEDGVLQAYAPYSSPSVFSMTPMTRVVGVDVYRGPSAILLGPQTIGGAIDFRTRDVPERLEASVDYMFGINEFSRLHFYVGASNQRFGALLEGLQARSEGFQRIDFTGGSNGFDLGDYALRAFWRGTLAQGIRHRLSAKLVYQTQVWPLTAATSAISAFVLAHSRCVPGVRLGRSLRARTRKQADLALSLAIKGQTQV